MKKQITLILIFTLQLIIAANQYDSNEIKVHAIKIENKIELDGKLDEPLYKNPPINNFTQRDPDEGEPATEKTSVWVGYDDSYIYVGVKLYDSDPELIDRMLVRKDNLSDSDWFFLAVDPYLDRRTGYYFGVNAGGSKADGILFNDSWDDDSWDGIWEVEVTIDDEGWTAEFKIPFSQMRFKEADDMKWGINFNRDIKRKNESSHFVMVPKEESGFVSRFATLEGLAGVKPKQRIEILPYIVQKAQYLEHEPGDPFYSSNQYKTSIGADFKIGIGSNLNLDGTINPDFGQVEVDPAVVNLSAFETFFPERRPFFIEGSNIMLFGFGGANNNWGFNFQTPELFYSRRIGRAPQGWVDADYDYIDYPTETRILGAAKLTGKIDESWSLGLLSSTTQRTYATYEYDGERYEQEVEPLTHYGVVRTQKTFNDGKQGLGMIFTSVNRDVSDSIMSKQLVDQAYTFGVDGWTFLDEDETYVITGNFIGSYLSGSQESVTIKQVQSYRYAQRPDATYAPLDTTLISMGGWFSRFMLNKQKGNFRLNAAIGAVSPGFENNDLGFQWNADKINGHIVLGYRWFEPDKIFRRKFFDIAHFRSYDFEGDNMSNGIMLFSHLQFVNYYNLGFRGGYALQTISRTLTRGGPKAANPSEYWFDLDLSTDNRENVVLGIDGHYSEDEIGGVAYRVGLGVEWKPFSQINFSVGPEYNRNKNMIQWVGNFEDPYATETYEHRYVFGKISQETFSANIRLNWTFTPKMSLQMYIQPLISVGNYSNYKELAEPRTLDYNMYGENGSTIDYNPRDNSYTVDPDGSGPAETFTFDNPNFNFKSFRANLVFRYEVLPGSILYFVWTNDRVNSDSPGEFNISRDFNALWGSPTNNVFLIKFTYWIDV